MGSRLLAYISTLRVRRVILVGSTLTLSALLLLALLVVFLPALLSTSPVQSLLRLGISKALKKPVSWSDLKVSWSDGVALSGLTLGDGPPPLLRATLQDLHLAPDVSRDKSSGRWCVSLDFKVKKLEADLAPGPPKPPEKKPLKDPLTLIAEGVQKFQSMDWPLPLDLSLSVDASPITLHYADPASKREVLLTDFAFSLAAPALSTLPVETSIAGAVSVDNGKPQPVHFKASISELVTARYRIRPSIALFAAQAGLPGVEFTADGGVTRPEGLKAKLRLSLPELVRLAAPFAKKALPEVGGSVALDLKADVDKAGDLQLALAVDGNRLAVSRLPGKRGGVGPVDLRLRQKLVSNHERQQVAFNDGSLTSPGLGAASWRALVDRPTEKSRSVAAEMGPVRLELGRARRVAAPFLPENLPVRELEGTVTVSKLTARLQGPGNDGEVAIEKLGVELPQLTLALAGGPLRGEGLAVSLDRAVIPLRKQAPVRVAADLSWSGRRLEISGKKTVQVRGMKGSLNLLLTEIDVKGKRAVADVRQKLELEQVGLGGELTLERMREELELKARALTGGALEASLPLLQLYAETVRASQSGRTVTLRPFTARFSAQGVQVPAKGKGSPTVQHAACSISASDALSLTAEAALTGQGKQFAASKGDMRLDLRRLMPVAKSFLPAGFDAAGLASASWDVAAPLPVAPLAKEENPLRKARGGLALLDRADVTLKLDELELALPASQGLCRVKGLSTAPQLRLVMPRATEPLRIDGGFRFASLSGLSGTAGTLPLQGGTLTLQGELAQWKELRLTEELKVASLGLSQVAELTVGRIDSLLEEQGGKFDAATLLKRLDATLFAHLEGSFPAEAKRVLAGWRLDGDVSAGARIDLTAARELRVRGYSKCRDLGVADGKGVGARGIRADLVVDRSYALARVKGDDWLPLSTGLVRPPPIAPFTAANSELAARIYEDLRGQSSGPRKIGVRSASFTSGAVPLEASALEADLLLEPQVLGVSFFQAEVGGGTVRARGIIDLSREVPVLSTYCNFSRLDPVLLFPAAGSPPPGGEGELTGELSLSAPLATEQRALLEGMRMNLNLRRFSSRILDRALFAVDPYQRNEKIVAQRKSLRLADLKGLRVSAVDGALDCEGEVVVKGVDVAIPKIERLRLSELPIGSELKRLITAITSSRVLLDLVRSDTLVVDPKGKMSLKRRSNAS
jgi:translocation and assembly module TamB